MALAASAIARKVGYLRIGGLPGAAIFDALPTRTFNPNRVIRLKNELALIQHGMVELRHIHYDKFVSNLGAGTLFGDLPLLGQSMLRAKALGGTPGATIAVMDADQAREWVQQYPTLVIEMLGSRLARVELDDYRSRFQLADSRVASLLLEQAGDGTSIVGMSHQEIGEQIGLYRETVTNVLNSMKLEGLIEIGRSRVNILDKRALRELSEM